MPVLGYPPATDNAMKYPAPHRAESAVARLLRSGAATAAAALVAAAAFFAEPADAQGPPTIPGWVPGSRVVLDGSSTEAVRTGARFGFAVAMTDDYAVIGAPDTALLRASGSSVNGAGAAYVFKRTAGTDTWTFVQRLIAPDLSLTQAGSAVAIDPATKDIIIGGWAYSGGASFGGGAWVYLKGSGDSWGIATTVSSTGSSTRMPSQELLPDDIEAIDEFGFSVAVHNGVAVIGSPLNGTSNSGALYIYDRDSDGAYQFHQKIVDEAGGANDQLGTKVAVHGNLIVAGVQNDDVQGRVNAGSALVYSRTGAGAEWSLAARLQPDTAVAGVQFGASVAVVDGTSTDYIVVGAPLASSGATTQVAGNGAAYVFTAPNTSGWTQQAKLLPRADNINNNFGYSVAVSHTEPPTVVVGAPGYDTAVATGIVETPFSQVVNAGTGFCFVKSGASWRIRGTGPLTGDLWSPAVVTAGSSIGRCVAVGNTNTNFALVGAETPTSSTGSMYPFEFATAVVGSDPGNVAGPSIGVLGPDGLPTDGSTPGTGSGGTGGGISGGGSPTTGTDIGGGVVIPLTPITTSWGLIKGTAVALRGQHISLLQTDGLHAGNMPRFKSLGDLPEGAHFVGIGDVNGDNSGDIVFVSDANVLKYWKRDAYKILDTVTVDALPTGYEVIAVADLDGDSKPDILMQDVTDPHNLTVWYLSGGAISSSTDYTLPAGDWQVLTGKFRTSTQSDILIRNAQERELKLLVDESGTVTYKDLTDHGRRGSIAGFGDMDGDGKQDIFWNEGDELRIDFYTQDDAGEYLRSRHERSALRGGRVVDVRDWNGDGKVDLWMRSGRENWVQYTTYTNHAYGSGSRQIGEAPGRVVGFAAR